MKRNERGVTVLGLLCVCLAIIVIFFLIVVGSSNGKYKIESYEGLSYTKLRTAIAQSTVDGTGSITRQEFNDLGSIVKSANSSNQWFSDNKIIYYGQIIDTYDKEVTFISDGTYVATFTVKIENPDSYVDRAYYLDNYTFEPNSVKGYQFYVKD